MVGKFRNTVLPPSPQLSLHRRAALSSNRTWSVYSRKNPKSSLYCEVSLSSSSWSNRGQIQLLTDWLFFCCRGYMALPPVPDSTRLMAASVTANTLVLVFVLTAAILEKNGRHKVPRGTSACVGPWNIFQHYTCLNRPSQPQQWQRITNGNFSSNADVHTLAQNL
jgi:hypothetical protein